jgi:hypothetical protein
MRNKVLSLALALIYFSVTVVLSGPHAHHHSALSDQQHCVACAWHFEANADAPPAPALIDVPLVVAIHTPPPDVQVDSLSPRSHSDRGPPPVS